MILKKGAGYVWSVCLCLSWVWVCVCTFVSVCVCTVFATRLGLGGVWSVRRCICFSCMSVHVCECVSGFVFVHLCVFVSVRPGWVWVGMERAALYIFFLYVCVRV